jgi:alkylation response protein AidB-like acyl-CoA dehydrogenase
VNFSFSAEQDAFRAEARRFLSERVDLRAQIALPGAHDPALWKEMASLGWFGVIIPAEYGGLGLGFVDVCVLLEETGRVLLPGPFMSTLIGGTVPVLLCGTDAQKERLLPRIASGEDIAAFADVEDDQVEGTHISGERELAHAAGVVDWLVVAPSSSLPLVAPKGSFTTTQTETADLTRPRFHVRFDGDGERMEKADLTGFSIRGAVATAAEMVGAARGALDMAVTYAKDRQQFDRPIGSFQAIKHKAADMLRALEAARLIVYNAAVAIDAGSPDAAVASSMAKAAAGDALSRCAAENIQIHGGIGVTWEHDAHLYYRRSVSAGQMFGSSDKHRDLVARALFAELPR